MSKESLKEVNKVQNAQADLQRNIEAFHAHGILVSSGCMVGFDHDDLAVFGEQLEFFTRLSIPDVRVYPLQALEGTRLKKRMVAAGRLWTGTRPWYAHRSLATARRRLESPTCSPLSPIK